MFQTTAYEPFSLSPTFEAHIPMVRFVLGTGRTVALPYFGLSRADYCPTLQAVELCFGGVVVELHGRGLEALYGHLCQHGVMVVRQAFCAEAGLLRDSQCVVERIVVRLV